MKPAIKPGKIPETMISIHGGMEGIARRVYHREDYAESIRVITSEIPHAAGIWCFGDEERLAWNGCLDARELLESFRLGKPGLIPPELLEQVSKSVSVNVQKRAGISNYHAQAGDEPDVSLFLSGEPECMLATKWEQEKPAITLHHMLGISHTVPHGDIVSHGLAVSAAINALESAGYAVELIAWDVLHPMPWNVNIRARWPDDTHTKALRKIKEKPKKGEEADPDNVGGIEAFRSIGWESGFVGHGVIVKEYNEPIHPSEIGFYLCHPSFIRAGMYAIAHNGNGMAAELSGYLPNGFPVHWVNELNALSRAYARLHGEHSRGIWVPRLQEFDPSDRTSEDAGRKARVILSRMGFL
jgi:hypothetical protein